MTLSEAVPLDCDVHKVFLFFFPPLGGTGGPEWAGVGYFSDRRSVRL